MRFMSAFDDHMLFPVILRVERDRQQLKGREKVKWLSQYARKALAVSAQKSGVRLDHLPKDNKGAPLPVNGIYWSLSHKIDFVAGVAAPFPVGIDIEKIKPPSDRLYAKIADPAEWQLTDGERLDSFFRFWTAKEAVLKAVGKGIAGLSRCRVQKVVDDDLILVSYDDQVWDVAHFRFEDHLVSVTKNHFRICWKHI